MGLCLKTGKFNMISTLFHLNVLPHIFQEYLRKGEETVGINSKEKSNATT